MPTASFIAAKLMNDGLTVKWLFNCAVQSVDAGHIAEFNGGGGIETVYTLGTDPNVVFVLYSGDQTGNLFTSLTHYGSSTTPARIAFFDGITPPVIDQAVTLYHDFSDGDATVCVNVAQIAEKQAEFLFDDTIVQQNADANAVTSVRIDGHYPTSAGLNGDSSGIIATFAGIIHGIASTWSVQEVGDFIWSQASGIDGGNGIVNPFGQRFSSGAPSLSSPLKYQMARFPRRRSYAG